MSSGLKIKLRIRHKLFFTILLTSTIVAVSLFLFLQWNFDRGFFNYVEKQELAYLDQLAEQLVNYYGTQGKDWRFMKENHFLWQRVNDNGKPPRHGMKPGIDKKQPSQFIPPPQLRALGPRTVLYDAQKNWIIGGGPEGPRSGLDEFTVRPVTYENSVVGYLGLLPATEFSYSGDLLFVEEQKDSFLLMTLIMIGLSVLLTFPVTIHLLRPIMELTRGTRKLISGQFRTRIPVRAGDELGQLSHDFNHLAMTLEQNENARKQWVADISHELRTPLSILRGDVEALQDGIRKLEPKSIELLHSEILHLERLVNDLYELSMSDIGALTYKKVEIDPISLLTDTVGLYEKRFADKGLELVMNIPVNLSPLMLGDPDRINQLFTNLLSNSHRYTNGPGILEIAVEADSEKIVIIFQDSAPGVSTEQSAMLFDRLFQADQSRNRTGQGAGLGLTICKNIVAAHQGTITAGDSPFGGIAFRLELPLNI